MTTTQPIDIIHKNSLGQWEFNTHRKFTNFRLVKMGGKPYTDFSSGHPTFKTRKAALATAEKMIANGWSIMGTRLIKDDTK